MQHVSAVAIASIAAACASMIWYERWQVRRAAVRRCKLRRSRGVIDWTSLAAAGAPGAEPLTKALERAVLAGDEVCAYERRLFGRGDGESPFRLRRRRVDAAQGRFDVALQRVRLAAQQWIEVENPASDTQQRFAIARLAERLDGDGGRELDPTIGVLEAALSNLYRSAASPSTFGPFRTPGHRT